MAEDTDPPAHKMLIIINDQIKNCHVAYFVHSIAPELLSSIHIYKCPTFQIDSWNFTFDIHNNWQRIQTHLHISSLMMAIEIKTGHAAYFVHSIAPELLSSIHIYKCPTLCKLTVEFHI